jgi:hypothetical protein
MHRRLSDFTPPHGSTCAEQCEQNVSIGNMVLTRHDLQILILGSYIDRKMIGRRALCAALIPLAIPDETPRSI